MPELKFTARSSGLMPINNESRAWLAKQPSDAVVTGKFSTDRNGAFHRKFFAMLNVAYMNWDNVEIETPHGKAKTSQKTFKDFCIVKSGHWQIDVTPEGNARYTPKSIKFGSMSQADFEKLYSDVLDVILAKFLTKWASEDMHDAVVNYIRDFG